MARAAPGTTAWLFAPARQGLPFFLITCALAVSPSIFALMSSLLLIKMIVRGLLVIVCGSSLPERCAALPSNLCILIT